MIKMPPLTADAVEVGAFECDCCNDVNVGIMLRMPDAGPRGEPICVAVTMNKVHAEYLATRIREAIENPVPSVEQGMGTVPYPAWANE